MRDWEEQLARRLVGGADLETGAEVEVRNPDGGLALLVPLARHYRIDEEANVLWIRPVVGGYVPPGGSPSYAFSLNEARVRGLPLAKVRLDGKEIVCDTGHQLARIREAGSETMPELERWDSFVYTVLRAEEEAELDALIGESYWGEWA